MAKSKWPHVQEKLIFYLRWVRDGLIEVQICNEFRD